MKKTLAGLLIVLGGCGTGGEVTAVPDATRMIKAAPIEGRVQNLAAWTGKEMLVWGGLTHQKLFADGAAYTPGTDGWRKLAPSPLTARHSMVSAWTGSKLVVWGGATSTEYGRPWSSDGAEYDPAKDSWQKIPKAPISVQRYAHHIWTGQELIVWGGKPGSEDEATPTAAGYTPKMRRWRTLPIPPLTGEAHAVGAGDRPMVFKVDVNAENKISGTVFDSATAAWQPVTRSPVNEVWLQGALWTGSEVFLVSPGHKTIGGYLYRDGQWKAIPPAPSGPHGGTYVWADGAAVSWPGDRTRGVAYVQATNRWITLPAVEERAYRGSGSPVWTGTELIVWGGNDCPPDADCVLKPRADGAALRLGDVLRA